MSIEPEELVSQFASAVQAQNACIRARDAGRGNKFALAYIESGKALLSGGPTAIERFAQLLQHEDPGVRVTTAAFLLEARTAEAVATLEPISQEKGLAGLGAHMTLERYKRGELRLRLDESG